ncbi:hypothetical protein IU471_00995 [Nocardia elegans]|uniref:MmyB family transcriptional regulator n=1 Tax=Nocardia elegans TaxID=300029 RepID=UPI001893EFC7|nr:hypothetical protein [Nocardia elegans]MBF6242155.1 hypothetical protein [Nocardia elegans]
MATLDQAVGRPNNVRCVFTDPEARQRFSDWDEIAADSVAHLRAATGRRPDDPTLRRLVADLHARSAPFRELWADHELRHKVSGHKRLYHPLVGAFTLDYVVLAVPNVPGQRLVAYSAEPRHDRVRRAGTAGGGCAPGIHRRGLTRGSGRPRPEQTAAGISLIRILFANIGSP